MIVLVISFVILFVSCNSIHPGPVVIASKGGVWPQPQQQTKSDKYFIVRPQYFEFKAPVNTSCPNLLNDAFSRYWTIIASSASLERRGRYPEVVRRKIEKTLKLDDRFLGYLDSLSVDLTSKCNSEDIRPQLGDDEKYSLEINEQGATLSAATFWGVLRGLETFTQLIYLENDMLVVNVTLITDFPRFSHRGLLLDTSRHFLPVYTILQTLDAMSYNKFNVFHWHITDDHSFPYKSLTCPELSEKGAYHPVSKVYEQTDISKIIEYARVRGIRVVPEFDTPGHTSSWGSSHPELLTACYSDDSPNGDLGPMDPTKQTTYDFLAKLFTEVVQVFPDEYFHIGGDEVDFTCWKNNPDVGKFMSDHNITTYEGLENYFVQNVVNLLDSLKTKYLVWEEVFVNGVTLPNNTVVHVWREFGLLTLSNVVQAGKFGIYSSCWYLDHLISGGDWEKLYICDPHNIFATDEQKKLVLGGEACMWAEYVNEYNIVPRIWPRASAVAEKLWSSVNVSDINLAKPRLEEHTCRMNHRGIAAQPPNGPGVCL